MLALFHYATRGTHSTARAIFFSFLPAAARLSQTSYKSIFIIILNPSLDLLINEW